MQGKNQPGLQVDRSQKIRRKASIQDQMVGFPRKVLRVWLSMQENWEMYRFYTVSSFRMRLLSGRLNLVVAVNSLRVQPDSGAR